MTRGATEFDAATALGDVLLKLADVDEERVVLGAMLLDLSGATARAVCAKIGEDVFTVAERGTAFLAIRDCLESFGCIDLAEIRRLSKLDGQTLLEWTEGQVLVPGDGVVHATRLLDLHRQRMIVQRASKVILSAGNGLDADGLVSELGAVLDDDARLAPVENEARRLREVLEMLPDVAWVWPKWIPAGLVSILAGESGIGKSAVSLMIADAVSRARSFPDATRPEGPGRVLWCDTEGTAALLKDRVTRWGIGGDLHVFFGQGPDGNPGLQTVRLDDAKAWSGFTRAVETCKPKLIVVDSLSGGHRANENAEDEVKVLLLRLADLARQSGAGLLCTHHLRKRSSMEPATLNLDRLRGSSTIGQFSRVVLGLDRPNPDRAAPARLSVVKNNLTVFAEPVGVEITETGVRFGAAPLEPHRVTAVDEAMALVREALADGPLPVTEVMERGEKVGLKSWAIKDAKRRLKVVDDRSGFGGGCLWRLPEGRG